MSERERSAMERLEFEAANLAAGFERSEDLPAIATDALVAGLDSPSLRVAAGTSPSDVREARDRFVEALDELGLGVPSEQDALELLVLSKATAIVTGLVAPYDGASWIWWNAFHRVERNDDLTVFMALASEWQDNPDVRPEIDTAIIQAARDVAERGGLR